MLQFISFRIILLWTSINDDIILIEQTDNLGQKKAGFFYTVCLGIDGVVESRAEVGTFEIALQKGSTQKIAVIKESPGEISFGKISFLKVTGSESGLLELQLAEKRQLQYTLFKIKLQQKTLALTELDTKKLAVPEFQILKQAVTEGCKTQVTPVERAAPEGNARHIGPVCVTLYETALFINPFGKRLLRKRYALKNPVFDQFGVHVDNIVQEMLTAKPETVAS